jgi:hypothetical protein
VPQEIGRKIMSDETIKKHRERAEAGGGPRRERSESGLRWTSLEGGLRPSKGEPFVSVLHHYAR